MAAPLDRLLYPELLKERLRVFTMVDAIVAREFPSFEFHPKWGRGQAMAAFKDGEGNEAFFWFSPKGTVVRAFEKDRRPVRGVFDGLPPALADARDEPAFGGDAATFCAWQLGARDWKESRGGWPRELFGFLAPAYSRWASEYYGRKLEPRALAAVWKQTPLDPTIIHALNGAADVRDVMREAEAIDWPKGKARAPSFGEAEFTVRCEPDRVRMVVHGKQVIVEARADIYEELFDLVKQRIQQARRAVKR